MKANNNFKNKIYRGNCLSVMRKMPDNFIDAIVTDPPYGLSFMGKKWDYDVPSVEIWKECFRVLKPGGYLLSFAGTRTQHRMACNIEDAGFEIRDMIAWIYGSGFPKSLNIGKAVDKLQGNEREDLGEKIRLGDRKSYPKNASLFCHVDGPGRLTKSTSEWEGWGTALKPALEPITVARKPLSEKSVAENVLKWGVGGLNIDGCRVGIEKMISIKVTTGFDKVKGFGKGATSKSNTNNIIMSNAAIGRFPANLIHDGSEEVLELFPNTKGAIAPVKKKNIPISTNINNYKSHASVSDNGESFRQDSGSAARFFYCAKASKSERNRGCEGLEKKQQYEINKWTENDYRKGVGEKTANPRYNNHPTVKPIALMKYLIKLVSKKGAIILDPFMGSGSTGVACVKKNRRFIGIELDKGYIEIAKKRIIHAIKSNKVVEFKNITIQKDGLKRWTK